MTPSEKHNDFVKRMILEAGQAADGERSKLNVIAESFLAGVGMFNYPTDPRRQAQIIQEISDAAQERVQVVRHD